MNATVTDCLETRLKWQG